MYYPGFDNETQRDDFFRAVSQLTRNFLPEILNGFNDATSPGNNWLKLVYPDLLPGSSFELQFVTKSRTHRTLFGVGNRIILAYYFFTTRKEILPAFMQAILPHRQIIETALDREVVIDYWGKDNARNYVIIGVRLAEEEFGINPKPYAAAIAKFIQAVFTQISSVTQSVRL